MTGASPEATELYESGMAFARAGDNARAEEILRRAAAMGHARSAFEVGYAVESRGELDEAEGWYRQAHDGGDAGGALNLGSLVEKRDPAAAMDLYRRAWELGAHEAAFNLGRMYDDGGKGDLESAATWYGRAVEHGNAGAAFNLGFVRSDQGDAQGQVAAWRRAAELEHPKAAGALGEHFQQRGDYDAAISWFRHSVQTVGNETAARRLSHLYESLGDARRAEYWRDFLTGAAGNSPEFEEFAADVVAVAIHRQELLAPVFGGDVEVDLEARTLTADGRTYGGVTLLGSFSHQTRTWLWGWANPAFSGHPAVADLAAVREHGERHAVPELATGHLNLAGLPAPQRSASLMASAAATLLGGNGVVGHRINDGQGTAYVHLDDPALPTAEFDRLLTSRLLMSAVDVFPGQARRVVLGYLGHHGFRVRESADTVDGRLESGEYVTVGFTEQGLFKAASVGQQTPGG